MISVILARLLGPDDFGLIGMILVFTMFAQIFSDMGLAAALIQKPDIEQRHLNSVFWMNVLVGVLLAGALMAGAPLVASFYEEPALRLLTVIISLNFLSGSLVVVQKALLQKKMEFKKLAFVEVFSLLVAGGVSISMALKGFGVWSLVAKAMVTMNVSVLLMWGLSEWRPSFSVDKRAVKDLIGYGSNLLGFQVFNYWARNLDNILIGRFIGASALGIYSRAYSLMLLPISQVNTVITKVMFPALCLIQDDVDRTKRVYLSAVRAIALFTFPLMIGLLVVAKPFILLLYGEKWRGVIPLIQLLCLTGMPQSVATTVGWIYTAQGRTDIMFKWGVFASALVSMAFVIGLQWGVVGVAASYVTVTYILIYPSYAVAGRLINLRFGEILKELSGILFCTAGMGMAVWCLGLFLPETWPHWAVLIVQVFSGATVYVSSVHLFNVAAYADLIGLLKGLRRSRMARAAC